MDGEGSVIRAVVRLVDPAGAIVEIAQGGCGRCHEKGGCCGHHLTQTFCSGPRRYRVDNAIGADVGDTVSVAVAAGTLRRGANLAYGLPVLGLIGGAVLGAQLGGDPGAIAGSLVGVVGAFALAARRSRQPVGDPGSRPHIISRIRDDQEKTGQ